MKVLNSSHISPFGGLNFVIQEFDQLGVGRVLHQELPNLPAQSQYDWRDLFYSSSGQLFFAEVIALKILHIILKHLFLITPYLKHQVLTEY